MGDKNKSDVDRWRTPDGLLLLQCWARDFSMGDVLRKVGVSASTMKRWRENYPEIDEAVAKGREVVDYQVENALLKSALGYTTTETKTIISPPDKNGNRAIRVEKTEKEIGPNTTSIMCWLNNRKPDQWKRNRDNVLSTEDKDNHITVNIINHGSKDKKDESDEEWNVETTTEQKSKSSKSNTVVKKKSDAKKSVAEVEPEYTDEELEWLEG